MSVSSQVYIFLATVIAGILIGFIYDWFRLARRVIRTGSILTHLQDLLFWIVVALVLFTVLFYSNGGEIRGYVLLGAAIGAVLYYMLLSKIFMAVSLFIIKILAKTFSVILGVFLFPFKLISRVLTKPARLLKSRTGSFFAASRRVVKNNMGRHLNVRKALTKIRKKI